MRLKIPDKKLVGAFCRSGLFRGSVYVYHPEMFNVVDWVNEQFHEELKTAYTTQEFVSLLKRKLDQPPKRVGWGNGYVWIADEAQWLGLYARVLGARIPTKPDVVVVPSRTVVDELPVLVAVRAGREFDPDVAETRADAERVRVREAESARQWMGDEVTCDGDGAWAAHSEI